MRFSHSGEQVRAVNAETGRFYAIGLCCFFLLTACSTVATYDQAAYEHATSVKVDTLALVGKATGNYADNSAEISKVKLALQKAYEYDKGRPLNDYTRKQWELLLVEKQNDPKSGILPRFFNRWQKKGSLKQAAVDDEKQNVSDAFDIIIQSESGKTHL
jgi:hypothetical protein